MRAHKMYQFVEDEGDGGCWNFTAAQRLPRVTDAGRNIMLPECHMWERHYNVVIDKGTYQAETGYTTYRRQLRKLCPDREGIYCVNPEHYTIKRSRHVRDEEGFGQITIVRCMISLIAEPDHDVWARAWPHDHREIWRNLRLSRTTVARIGAEIGVPIRIVLAAYARLARDFWIHHKYPDSPRLTCLR